MTKIVMHSHPIRIVLLTGTMGKPVGSAGEADGEHSQIGRCGGEKLPAEKKQKRPDEEDD